MIRYITIAILLATAAVVVPCLSTSVGTPIAAANAPLTVLLMGVDARPGAPIDVGVRPDALLVLRLDPARAECRVLSVPRDTRAEVPGYGKTKINHALMVGGIPFQQLVVEQFLGLPVDRYALIDFAGFRQVVDTIGGVSVTVPAAIRRNGKVLVAAGRQTLDGARALVYARYRYDANGDLGRIQRQWLILRGLIAVATERDPAADIRRLLPAIEDHIRTDLTATELVTVARTFRGRCTAETLGTAVLEGGRVRMTDPILRQPVYYHVVSDGEIRMRVAELIGSP